MKARLLALFVVCLSACGSDDPDAPLDVSLDNLVGYWGGTEVVIGGRGLSMEPQVLHVRKNYGGLAWYGEAVGYESNFEAGSVELSSKELVLTDFQGHPPVRLQLDQVTQNALTFRSSLLDHTWNLYRQEGCVVPLTMLHEFGATNPVFLNDGTLVFQFGALTRRVRPGHCIQEDLALPAGTLAAANNGELWILDNTLTPTREVRLTLHRVTDLDADPPTVMSEIVAESETLNGNENYEVADDGTGRPVVVVSQSNWIQAWRKEDAGWVDFPLPEQENNTIYAWRDGDLVAFPLPEDPEEGRPAFPYVTPDGTVWGLFLESLNGYHGLIRLGRLDGTTWTKWAVGYGQMRGLRVREDGVVDIAINESLENANMGFIQATPDGDRFLARHRRVQEGTENGRVDDAALAFGPKGAMFLRYFLRRPADERGERETYIPVSLTLGEGVTRAQIPALGVSCEADCEFTIADNEAYEVRLTATSVAELAEVEPGPSEVATLDESRSTLMVPGTGFRMPWNIQIRAQLAD